jgi:hypothetical protein
LAASSCSNSNQPRFPPFYPICSLFLRDVYFEV